MRVAQRIERVEELLLRALLPRQELDVVDQEQVHVPVLVAERQRLGVLDRVDHLVGEALGGHVVDAQVGPAAHHLVADGVQQVGLAQARAAEDEERVVGVPRVLRDGHAGGVRETVAAADDEALERVPGTQLTVEPQARGARLDGRGDRGTETGPGLGEERGSHGLEGREADLGLGAQHLRQALAQCDQVVFVDPIHEEGVGDFQLDELGADGTGDDRLEPGVQRLGAAEADPAATPQRSASPKSSFCVIDHAKAATSASPLPMGQTASMRSRPFSMLMELSTARPG